MAIDGEEAFREEGRTACDTALLKQDKHRPMSLHAQVITLILAGGGVFTDVPVAKIGEYREEILSRFEAERPALCLKIDHGARYSDELKGEILSAAEEFKKKD